MIDDWFQDTKADLFQVEFLPGRGIPEYEVPQIQSTKTKDTIDYAGFVADKTNTSAWITVIYQSAYYAEKAAKALPELGLNIFYPKCRAQEKEIKAQWDLETTLKKRDKQATSEFVPAYGRYLFIQLPEDQETFENLEITERMLSGRFNENGVVNIMAIDGQYSLTTHAIIMSNQAYHIQLNTLTDPKVALRYEKYDVVKVIRGNLSGYSVVICDDVFMYFKLTSKIEVLIGNTGRAHYVKVGDLEKICE